jgi:uncharacterized protein YchJ
MAPRNHLTPAQQRALVLLSAGSNATAAAQFVGVHRNTVGNWLRSATFREALAQTRRDRDLAWRDQARSLAGQALGAIQAVLADPQASAAVRLKAALAIQGRAPAQTPALSVAKQAAPKAAAQPGRNQPCPCGSGRKFKHCCISIR